MWFQINAILFNFSKNVCVENPVSLENTIHAAISCVTSQWRHQTWHVIYKGTIFKLIWTTEQNIQLFHTKLLYSFRTLGIDAFMNFYGAFLVFWSLKAQVYNHYMDKTNQYILQYFFFCVSLKKEWWWQKSLLLADVLTGSPKMPFAPGGPVGPWTP